MLTVESFIKEFANNNYTQVTKSQWAIVLGCDAESSKKRAAMAADFFQKGGAERIIVSGGVLRQNDGRQMSESEIMKQYLVQHGVPASVIVEERRATDTVENFVGSLLEICQHDSVFEVSDVTVITQGYHLPRAMLLAKIFLPNYVNVHGYTLDDAESLQQNENLANEVALINRITSKTAAFVK